MQFALEIKQIKKDIDLKVSISIDIILDNVLYYLNDHLELLPNHQSVLETLEAKENEISNLEEKIFALELEAATQEIIKQVPPESGDKKKGCNQHPYKTFNP